MAQFVNMHKVELSNGVAPVVSLRQIFYGDVDANRIGAIVQMNGTPVALGGTCSGTAILADGSTVALTGTVSGNEAYVVLPAGCYSIEGQIQVFVKLTVSGVTTTLLAAVGTVRLTETDQIIDPGTIIPSVAALISDISDAVASIPADYTTLLGSIAHTFSSSESYTAGKYVWYNGELYRFNVAHPAGAWIGTDAARYTATDELPLIQQALGTKADAAEVAELKSAIDFSLGIEKQLDYATGMAYNASISPSANVWNVTSQVMGYIIPLSQVSEITIKSNATNGSIFALLKTDNHAHNTTPDYATGSGRTYIAADTTQTVIVPNDANYIYITDHLTNNVSYLPQSVTLSTYIDASAAIEAIEEKTSAYMDIDVSKYPSANRYISPSANVWAYQSGIVARMITVPNQSLTFAIKGNEQSGSIVAILADDDTTVGTTPVYATGYTTRLFVSPGEVRDYTLPSDARYIWIMMANSTTDFSPVYAKVNYYVTFSDIENDLNDLKSYHPNYSGKKLSILGDSISTFALPSEKVDGKADEGCTTNYPGNPVQYSNSDVTSVSATWWGRVLNQFGMVLGINESWAGSTISYNPNQTSGGKYTADNCLCSATRIGHLGENGTPDIIIVFGGTNDINHHRVSNGSTIRYAVGSLDSEHNPYDFDSFPMVTETYYGSITTMLLRIQHTYPNATILMLLPYFCTYTHTSSGDIATPYDQNEWSNAAIDVCKFLGVEYLDLRTIINLYDVSSLLFDGLHPKANGMAAIAKAVIHKLNSML